LADVAYDYLNIFSGFVDYHPHSVCHSPAIYVLQSGVAFSVIALWLGHESMMTTHRYVEADLTMKQTALARLEEPTMEPTRYQPPDELMRFLLDL